MRVILRTVMAQRYGLEHGYDKRREQTLPPLVVFEWKSCYWTVTTPFMFIARCGTQVYGYFPALMFAKETVMVSPGFIFMLLESSPILSVPIFASSCGLTSAGTVATSKATLCGPPETMIHLMPSPCLTVMFAGSNRYPFASPTIFTSWVVPVIGAIVPVAPPAGGVGVLLATWAEPAAVSIPTAVVSPGRASPPAQALSPTIATATANP